MEVLHLQGKGQAVRGNRTVRDERPDEKKGDGIGNDRLLFLMEKNEADTLGTERNGQERTEPDRNRQSRDCGKSLI